MHPDEPAETHAWLSQLHQGNAAREQAWNELVRKYQRRLLVMVCCRLDEQVRSRLDPEDVLQSTYREALRQLDRYLQEPRVPFYIWLRGLAWERLCNEQRFHLGTQGRTARREVHLSTVSSDCLARQFLAPGSTPSEALCREERCQLVHNALAQLRPKDREVLLLLYFEGMTNNEAAHALGLTPQGVTMRNGRAFRRFKDLLAPAGAIGGSNFV